MPGVQLSALVAATDAPLLFFLGLTILAYVTLLEARGPPAPRPRGGARRGAGPGVPVQVRGGLFRRSGWASTWRCRHARGRRWTPCDRGRGDRRLGRWSWRPTSAWNAAHGFATFQHTAANAAWSGVQLFNITEMATFVVSQFGVFGPIPLGALIVGVVLAARRRLALGQRPDPAVLHPAAAGDRHGPGLHQPRQRQLVGGGLPGGRGPGGRLAGALAGARNWLIAALAIQGVVAAFFLAAVMSPGVADKAGLANGLKRARGWSQTAELILDRADREPRPDRHRGQQPLPVLRRELLRPRPAGPAARAAGQLAADGGPAQPGRDDRALTPAIGGAGADGLVRGLASRRDGGRFRQGLRPGDRQRLGWTGVTSAGSRCSWARASGPGPRGSGYAASPDHLEHRGRGRSRSGSAHRGPGSSCSSPGGSPRRCRTARRCGSSTVIGAPSCFSYLALAAVGDRPSPGRSPAKTAVR